ncbi:hypothetical protein GCM10027168_41470 [Streptomyces capparidis]
MVSDYRIEGRLGTGGMGVVYLARSLSGEQVAVKVIREEWAQDPGFRARFELEVAAARMVHSAFTAPVVDADPCAVRPWMATLLVPGESLSARVRNDGALPDGELRLLAAGLAQALRDIHRAGLVHRDLKPGNVLMTADGPCVIDFGVARAMDGNALTCTGQAVGTPSFMAPEQFTAPRDTGPAADVFALGCVLVFATTGSSPFAAGTPEVAAYRVVHEPPDLHGVPQWLVPLVRTCLDKRPDGRPQPHEVLEWLARAQTAPAQDLTGRILHTGKRLLRSKPAAVSAAFVLLAGTAVVGFQVGATYGTSGGTDQHAGDSSVPREDPARWSTALSNSSRSGGKCVLDGVALYCGSDTTPVTRIDTRTGHTVWQSRGSAGSGFPAALIEGQLFVEQGGEVWALSAKTGAVKWLVISGKSQRVSLGGTTAYAIMYGSAVHPSIESITAINAHSNTRRWKRTFSADEITADPITTSAGLFLTNSNGVAVIDQDTGRTLHRMRMELSFVARCATTRHAAYLSDPYKGILLRVDLHTLHKHPSTHQIEQKQDKYTGRMIVAAEIRTGRTLWQAKAPEMTTTDPLVTSSHVYVGMRNGGVIAYDKGSGKEAWHTGPPTTPGSRDSGPAAPRQLLFDGDRLIVVHGDLTIRRIDPAIPDAPAEQAEHAIDR